jgi:hypothetical protein
MYIYIMSGWEKVVGRDPIQDSLKLFRLRPQSALLAGLGKEGVKNFIMHTMTAIGAWGGFPDAPLWWNDMMKLTPYMPWVMMCVLCFQGGDEQDFQMSIEYTIVLYFIYHGTNHLYKMAKKSKKKK